MSYVISPSGVQNPLTENLDGGGFDIDDLDTLNVNTVNGASPTGLKIGSNASQKLAFHGSTPIVQAGAISTPILTPQPPSYSSLAVDGSLNELKTKIDDMLAVLRNLGLIET